MVVLLSLLVACGSSTVSTKATIDTSTDTADTGDTSGGADSSDSGPDSGPPDSGPPPGDCTDPAYNPWLGSCLDGFFEPCFDPSGTCSTDTGTGVVTWPNGPVVAIVQGGGMPPALSMTLTGADGSVCATGETVEDDACGAGNFAATFIRSSDSAALTVCILSGGGGGSVTCPDGSSAEAASGMGGLATCLVGGDESCNLMPGPPQP